MVKEGKICFAAAEQIKTVLKYLTDLCQVNYRVVFLTGPP